MMTKIDQKQFALLFGAFNILVSLNRKIIENGKFVESYKSEFNTWAQKFKSQFNELTEEQKPLIDLIEFKLEGYDFESYADFVDSL